MEKMLNKKVSDLGAGAYLMMHGYKVIGKQGRDIVFEVEHDGTEEFEQKILEYLASDFHRFDSYLMSLKKIGGYNMPNSGN